MWKIDGYETLNGQSPIKNFLDDLKNRYPVEFVLVEAKIKILKELGNQLRRPHADYLRDGIYELRTHKGRVQLRILYFFDDKTIILTRGIRHKEEAVPDIDIERSIEYCKEHNERKKRREA